MLMCGNKKCKLRLDCVRFTPSEINIFYPLNENYCGSYKNTSENAEYPKSDESDNQINRD